MSNAVVVRGEGGLTLVDPGIDGSDLNQLADDLDRLGIPVVAGFSTHPHRDHLLGISGSATRRARHRRLRSHSSLKPEGGGRMPAESASGIPLELLGLVTPLPADALGDHIPGGGDERAADRDLTSCIGHWRRPGAR